mmetsp:Transcript_3286/g.8163  ORF Transcript_3286/g.8163 Transcript_3286/m.8163 type:complete len:249 (-) Transcript_3286:321-1067(-)
MMVAIFETPREILAVSSPLPITGSSSTTTLSAISRSRSSFKTYSNHASRGWTYTGRGSLSPSIGLENFGTFRPARSTTSSSCRRASVAFCGCGGAGGRRNSSPRGSTSGGTGEGSFTSLEVSFSNSLTLIALGLFAAARPFSSSFNRCRFCASPSEAAPPSRPRRASSMAASRFCSSSLCCCSQASLARCRFLRARPSRTRSSSRTACSSNCSCRRILPSCISWAARSFRSLEKISSACAMYLCASAC